MKGKRRNCSVFFCLLRLLYDKMSKDACYHEIMDRIKVLFTPTKEEEERLSRRLSQLDETELENLCHNFDLMGIDTILEYLCECYL